MDSSISDAEVTVNLDDSDWVPPDISDDDSIEIVGEVSQLRTTRSRAIKAAPNTHLAGQHNPFPRHDQKSKKQQVFERGRYFTGQRGRTSSRGRPPQHQSPGERVQFGDQYRWAEGGYQSPAAARFAAASPSGAGASMGAVTIGGGEMATPVSNKRKLAPDGKESLDEHAPSNKHFKEPTPVKKGKKRNSLSRVPKKSKRMTSLRSTHGPPLGGSVDAEKLKKIDSNATRIASYMLSPTTKHNHGSWVRNPKNLDDSDLFELDRPDVELPSNTHSENFNNLPLHNRNGPSVHNLCKKSTVDIGGKAVENFSMNITVGNISYPVIKSEKSATDIEIISPTTSTPVALPNKTVKSEARINHRIARLFGEDGVTSRSTTTPPCEKQAPVLRFITLRRPSVVVSSSNCATPPSLIGRDRLDILSKTRSPLVPQAASQTPQLLDSSVCSVKSPKTELDLTSSFEFSPARPSFKGRLSMLKKASKRASLTMAGRKVKSPAVAKSKSLVAAAIKSKTLVNRTKAIDPDVDAMFEWDAARVISERQGVSESQARQVICLFQQECTLPFIARYRRENTGNMEIEKLREVQNAYEQLKAVKVKVAKVVKEDLKKNELSPDTKASLLNATSLQEVKTLTASLKASKGKRTFADRARQLGLTGAADALLNDHTSAQSQRWALDLVNHGQEGRSNLEEVETGLKFIVADVISKDPKMLAYMKAGLKQSNIPFASNKARKIKSQEKASSVKPKKVIVKRKSIGGKTLALKKCAAGSDVSPSVVAKYEKYFDFSMSAWRIMPHVVCAINRGEQQGVLTVKITMPPFVYTQFMRYCNDRWLGILNQGHDGNFSAPYRRKLLLDALPDCYDRLVSPSLQSWIRSELSDAAELASIEVFATNLRSLLLTPPVKVNTVLAIDPGFNHGCKLAVVERKGKVLAVDTIFPFGGRHQVDEAVVKFRQLVVEYRCEVVCIGNGTACRQTETWLSELIQSGVFGNVNVQYTIIDESGASQYSVTPEAKEEFPDLDINHISAVSLARRLQDPLLEYVKVPPMHLGVGMYQHDVASKLLKTSLDSVVMECVSFVGVDLNVASEFILKKVSGLNKARAAAIVKHREDCGAFRSRDELRKVKGIGPISFQQCAGFVRIVPQTLRQRSSNSSLAPLCPLDSTTVHPESYDSAKKLIALAGVDMKDIGTAAFTTALRSAAQRFPPKELCGKVGCSEATLHVILESMYQPLDFDFRGQFDQPLFRKGVTRLEDLKRGEHMTGSVRNVTPFGAFIDIGVGNNGLLHNRYMNGQVLQLGNTVTVEIMNVEAAKGRISLNLIQVMG